MSLINCEDATLQEECATLPSQKTVQTSERSAADSIRFKAGNVQYAFVKANYIDKNATPKFSSHTDYITWKRMNAQLHSGK